MKVNVNQSNEVVEGSEKRTPHDKSSMILGIVSISAFFFYGAGIVLGLIAQNQLKKDEIYMDENPSSYIKSKKLLKVTQITSKWGIIVSSIFFLLR